MSLRNRQFGKLTIRYAVDENDRVLRSGANADRFYCDCACGNELVVWRSLLVSGVQIDCGMCVIRRDQHYNKGNPNGYGCWGHSRAWATRSGKKRCAFSSELTIWRGMINRCKCKAHPSYDDYGRRGIRVCDRWMCAKSLCGRVTNPIGFKHFLEDMGPRPAHKTLDRIDPCGHYEPTNCRWADAKTQIWNQRRFLYPDGNEPPVEKVKVMEQRVQAAYDWEVGVAVF